MKILQYDCQSVIYKPVSKSKHAEELVNLSETQLVNATVLFITVETQDNASTFKKLLTQINPKFNNILVYPYAHLSKDLASSTLSLSLIKDIVTQLKLIGSFVTCAPFGWIKQITLKSIGETQLFYDSDELSKTQDPNPSQQSKSYYLITDHNLNDLPLQNLEVKTKAAYNLITSQQTNSLVEVLDDPITSSKIYFHSNLADAGNPFYTTEGTYLFNKIYDIANLYLSKSKYHNIKTSTIWSTKHILFKNYLSKFPSRQYIIKQKNDSLVLRFACCFGAMEYFKKDYYTSKDLPIGFYEIGEVFRYQQKGQVMGLRRLRKFTMTDLHVICNENWLDEVYNCLDLSYKTMNDLYLLDDLNFIIRYYKDFSKIAILQIVKRVFELFGITDVIHQVLDSQDSYWVFKLELAVNVKNDLVQLTTVQIDTWNGEHCDLSYFDHSQSKKVRPIIIHCSPLGSIDRIVHVLMNKPIPYNLRRIQLRILDFDKQLPKAELLEFYKLKGNYELIEIQKNNFSKNIKELRQSLVPYYIVYGYSQKQGKNIELQSNTGETEASFKTISELVIYLNRK